MALDESKHSGCFLAFFVLLAMSVLSLAGGVMYVAWHFIAKYW